MELLNLILVCGAFSLFSFSTFCNLMCFNLFLRIGYKLNLMNMHDFDPIMLMLNIINILMHFFVYKMTKLIGIINNTKWGNYVLEKYNYLNNKYVNIKNSLIHTIMMFPIKFVMKNLNKPSDTTDNSTLTNIIHQIQLENRVNSQKIPVIRKTTIDTNIELNTNKDISNFLDNLLETNKTKQN